MIKSPFLTSVIVLFTAATFSFFPHPALCDQGPAGNRISTFIKDIDAGLLYDSFYTGKQHESFDFQRDVTGFYIGSKNSTRAYWSEVTTDVTEDTWHHKSLVRYDQRRGGVFLETRFSSLPRHRFGIGFEHKSSPETSFTRVSYMGDCGDKGGCNMPLGFNEVDSNSTAFSYRYDFPGPWQAGFSIQNERMVYRQSTRSFVLRTGGLSFDTRWRRNRWNVGLGIARLSPKNNSDYQNSIPDNTHVELDIDYRPVKHVTVGLRAGYYSKGMPTAGGDFTEIGQKLAIPYLTGDDPFEKLYTQKFGYYVLGVNISLK